MTTKEIRDKLVAEDKYPEIQEDKGEEKYPESELSYFRCDYDGYRWWNTIWPIHRDLFSHELGVEFDEVYEALKKMFPNLGALREYCKANAQKTSDPTEYNAYLEMEYGYYWIRFITRGGDYNMYIHCYRKDAFLKNEKEEDQ